MYITWPRMKCSFLHVSVCCKLMIIFVRQHVVLRLMLYTAACCMQMHGKTLCINSECGEKCKSLNIGLLSLSAHYLKHEQSLNWIYRLMSKYLNSESKRALNICIYYSFYQHKMRLTSLCMVHSVQWKFRNDGGSIVCCHLH